MPFLVGGQVMEQKYFFDAFNILYTAVHEELNIYQKEELYRRLFKDIYSLANDGLYDNDTIRKVTSGNITIHLKACKKLHTYEGFEIFRKSVDKYILPYIKDRTYVCLQLAFLCEKAVQVPRDVYEHLKQDLFSSNSYLVSRAIAGIIDCLNYSDYLVAKGKDVFIDTKYMRLSSKKPLAVFPKYITEAPDAGVKELIGRSEDLKILSDSIFDKRAKVLISAVGGLGKTELVKKFLDDLLGTEIRDNGIEAIAWVSYNNSDIRLSMKEAFNLKFDLSDVWTFIQETAADYGERLLIVVDNIESTEDAYLSKLCSLQCRVLVTSRRRNIPGFKNILSLEPLKMDKCRELFYRHYEFGERNNETLNDIIKLTAKLTIMIVFIAKVACLEEMTLHELYASLVAKGFKLSDEDVSCEHEKLYNDDTIIRQMCILFSLVKYNANDKVILTYISIIPNLQFDFSKAKKWFGIKKNSSLMKLFHMGMLEQDINKKKHIYWMHSVIAAAVREQQKEQLYDFSRPFINILSEELDTSPMFGREYEKAYLIPFSWSVADIMENHWSQENDTDFLLRLFHVCFACSNFSLCEQLIDVVIKVQKDSERFSVMDLAYSYRNKIDMLLQFDRVEEAVVVFGEIEKLFEKNHVLEKDKSILNSQYGILYQIRGDYKKSRSYFDKCIKAAEESKDETRNKDKSTAYANMARMLVDAGEFFEAYDYIKKAIAIESDDDKDSDSIICYSTLGNICTELMAAGYGTAYSQEAADSFKKVIKFREKNLGKHHADTAVAYHDYAYYWYICGVYDKALKYNEKAGSVEEELFAAHSITRMRNLNTKALIIWEQGDYQKADDIFEYVIKTSYELSDDYLVDVADFEFNYARCLHDQGDNEKAKEFYRKCIFIWSRMSEDRNRKLVLAHQEYADILFGQGNPIDALLNYEKAAQYNVDDFYIMVDVMDSIAACLLLCQRIDEGIQKFIELLEILVTYKVTEEDIKYELCNNLLCLLDANSEEEFIWKQMLTEQIKDNSAITEYVYNFLENLKEK